MNKRTPGTPAHRLDLVVTHVHCKGSTTYEVTSPDDYGHALCLTNRAELHSVLELLPRNVNLTFRHTHD